MKHTATCATPREQPPWIQPPTGKEKRLRITAESLLPGRLRKTRMVGGERRVTSGDALTCPALDNTAATITSLSAKSVANGFRR